MDIFIGEAGPVVYGFGRTVMAIPSFPNQFAGLYLQYKNLIVMALPVNDKKNNNKKAGGNKANAGSSKFIKTSSKSANVTKKIRSTGANRGS